MTQQETIQPQSFAQRDRFKRVSQRDILPQAVKTRSLGDVIRRTAQAQGSQELDNGEQVVFEVETVSKAGVRVLAIPDISVYVGSATSANQLPGGSSIDESDWQFIGPWQDLAATDGNTVNTIVYVRNISAGTSTVILQVKSRLITNRLDVSTS